ncbi:MAG TPA: hypothetical protein VKT77_19355 [Chthonomonadaceae bacterium]|nr:hypothetical protein [Chthonomonadaceae bacterium]
MSSTCRPAIISRYRNYDPPFDVSRTVEILLGYVPEGYLGGLKHVELTNSTATRHLRRGKTWSRGKKVRLSRCSGFYLGDHIQLLVDNLLPRRPGWQFRFLFVRGAWIARVLYHEIGHHIHRTKLPVYEEREDVADRWRDYLLRVFIRRRFWYLRPIGKPLGALMRAYSRWRWPD